MSAETQGAPLSAESEAVLAELAAAYRADHHFASIADHPAMTWRVDRDVEGAVEPVRYRLAAVERERDEARRALDDVWAHCRVIYYPPNGEYPIEHTAAARVDMRRAIEARLAARPAETPEGQ